MRELRRSYFLFLNPLKAFEFNRNVCGAQIKVLIRNYLLHYVHKILKILISSMITVNALTPPLFSSAIVKTGETGIYWLKNSKICKGKNSLFDPGLEC